MRTTLSINDDVLAAAKAAIAKREKKTVGKIAVLWRKRHRKIPGGAIT